MKRQNNNLKHKIIMVTGASGFLAQALITTLLKKTDAHLILTCRKKESCSRWKNHPNVTVAVADLLELAPWTNIFKTYRPEVVFHLAAVARLYDGEANPETAFKVNFFGTVHLMKLAMNYGTGQFLFTSSDLARNAISAVGIGKYLIERIIIANKHPSFIMKGIRIANLIDGTGSVTIIFRKQIQKGLPVTITHPEMSRRFATREEAAQDLLWMMQKGAPNSIYVVHKKPLKIIDLAKQMMKEAGKETEIHFTGIRPGEKLSEPSYDVFVIKPVKGRDLALFDPVNYQKEDIEAFIKKVKIPEPLKKEAKNKLKELGVSI